MKMQCIKIEKGQSFDISEDGWVVSKISEQADGFLVLLQWHDFAAARQELNKSVGASLGTSGTITPPSTSSK